ncbi:response regulator transcription factor [Litchfieldia alkalitelluris]|uniref:response regulator transcription factor n=1 Tax=Litchfieldia alkalitelluris TaxID=304268 RepID=UPI00195EF91F|nr:helix-turn-helix transcriptional regulator [Litchfieldia alkalitelluris]
MNKVKSNEDFEVVWLNVTKDLLKELFQAYYSLLKCDLMLIDSFGNVIVKHKEDAEILLMDDEQSVKQLTAHVNNLKKPTVIHVETSRNTGSNYIVSPLLITGDDNQHLIVAGPFEFNREINFTEIMFKVENLTSVSHCLLANRVNRSNVKDRYDTVNELMNHDFAKEHEDHILLTLLEECRTTLYRFDFIGVAKKVDGHLFEIAHMLGQEASTLEGERFYVGEGFLGQVAAEGTCLRWEHIKHSPRAGVFTKHGIYPDHLFALPLNAPHYEGIVFGGKYDGKGIEEDDLHVVKDYVNYIVLCESVYSNIRDQHTKSHYYQLLVDFLVLMIHTKNPQSIIHKLLDTCISSKLISSVCLTTRDGQFFARGYVEEIECHHLQFTQQRLHNLVSNLEAVTVESDTRVIHKVLHGENEVFGVLTFKYIKEIDEVSELNHFFDLFVPIGIDRILINETNSREPHVNIMELLYENIIEIDQSKFQFIKQIEERTLAFATFIELNSEQKYQLQWASRLSSYQSKFLKSKLPSTEIEIVAIISETENLANRIHSQYKIESQILSMVRRSVQGISFEDDPSLSKELIAKYLEFYNQQRDSLFTKEPIIDQQVIENIKDIKSVIEQLPLTVREQQVLYLILEGLNNQEVAEELTISTHTVKNHLTNIFRKLDVVDRVQAMAKIYKIKYHS